MNDLVFKDIWILFLMPFVLMGIYFIRKRHKTASFQFPTVKLITDLPTSLKTRFLNVPILLRIVVLILFLISLSGPRQRLRETVVKTEGVDIVLAIDISQSMGMEDFVLSGRRVNRLKIAKEVVKDFISQRKDDRISLVTFGRFAYTISPLTTDYSWLKANLERIQLGLIDGTKTAIGSAITSSVVRLKESQSKSKIVILLTDGVNNAGKIDPVSAANVAETFGIKVYTIGVGADEYYAGKNLWGQKVYKKNPNPPDEALLTEIANITEGVFYRATDTESLRGIYEKIDALEKTEFEEIGYFDYKELFTNILLLALGLLVIELILSNTLLLKVP